MNQTEAAQTFSELYAVLYHHLHTRWDKDEQRPSPEALAVLTHLKFTGPLTVSEAALHFKRAQSAISEMVDRLQANGWIERIQDGRDRRRTLVWLTPSGEQVLARSQQVLDLSLLGECLAFLTEEEQRQLTAALQKLVNAAHTQTTLRRNQV
jgi:DNA-binding MarR family transcriptional regulator